ncbi:MAG TPA: NAD(P)H-dependent oxidoreductase [Solirubrobacterales bacterium]|jgi:chromate reductase|nr:NAD(P)H-dependent oxidoreductase [Solirubrobacterales bacterium]
MKILGISGSLRKASYNSRLLQAASRALPGDAELTVFDGLRDLPHYDADLEQGPEHPAVSELRRAIREADALLFVTPEYNGTIPGVLKNAVDWASRPKGEAALKNKTSAVIGASTGQFGGVWAQADLRKSLGLAGARAIDQELAVPKAADAFNEDGSLIDEGVVEGLSALLVRLVEEASPVTSGQLADAA